MPSSDLCGPCVYVAQTCMGAGKALTHKINKSKHSKCKRLFTFIIWLIMCGAYVPGCCCEGQRTTYSSFCPVAWVIRPCHWPGFTARFTVRVSRFLMKLSTFWPLILSCRINLVLKVYIVTPISFFLLPVSSFCLFFVSFGQPGICCLTGRDPPASASCMLGSQARARTAGVSYLSDHILLPCTPVGLFLK